MIVFEPAIEGYLVTGQPIRLRQRATAPRVRIDPILKNTIKK